ncbi:MAG TPA: DUF72 domain-containing protein [Chitinophagales bacterium]|nr:DUF72 domain-containing protein [Chitinophagales bacterium]
MQFGKVETIEGIDLSLPSDHPDTIKILGNKAPVRNMKISVGCAKWNKTDLKNFYPRGVKDELVYYSSQFNSIELNATFYQAYGPEQFEKWYEKTPATFRFFPKIPQTISHLKRLNDVKKPTEEFCNAAAHLEEKLGMVFLQLHDNFKPKDFDRLEKFVKEFPKGIPLAVELRNTEWVNNQTEADRVCELFKKYKITNVIVDTAGRRDLIHMRLTTPVAFVRYVGANHESDYTRLDPWIKRIVKWQKAGLKELNFFIHQNHEVESPLLSAYFIKQLNKALKTDLHAPISPPPNDPKKQTKLFP